MKIKKTFQGVLPENKILNTESSSQTDTYSCDYINNLEDKNKTTDLIIKQETGVGIYNNDSYIHNGICHINGRVNFVNAVSTSDWSVIGKIDDKYAPKVYQSFPAVAMTSSYDGLVPAFISVFETGDIKVWCKGTNIKIIVFNAEWRIDTNETT